MRHLRNDPTAISEEEAYQIGIETYLYAYPMVLMELTRRVGTNVARSGVKQGLAPMNCFAHQTAYANARHRNVVRPNADTLYSSLWFDVGREPLILTLPDTDERYHVIPFMDMWTDVFATLGTRTNGNGGGLFALVGPNWRGELPAGVRPITSPTEVGWVIGRIQTNGVSDYPNVHALQADMTATPLSAWGRAYTPDPGPVDPTIERTSPPIKIAQLTPDAFFACFAELLKRNPPHAADYAMLLRMERLGIVPGNSFSLADAPPAVQRALMRAAPDAYGLMQTRGPSLRSGGARRRNGWRFSTGVCGTYGNEYLIRAYVAYYGLGALPAQEAIYPLLEVDAQGQRLDGAAQYVLHFAKDQIPPVKAFWSLTLYGPDMFFVDNDMQRYAIGDRDNLVFNADGSLDLYIQHMSPGPDKASNWLPAPAAGGFDLMLRLYLPEPQASALEDSWTPPPIQRMA